MVSRADVIAAYRHVLRREPESEAVIAHHLETPTIEALYWGLIGSPEFQAFYLQSDEPRPFKPSAWGGAPPAVEVTTSDGRMAELAAIVEKTWTGLGQSEPYWSVLTNDSYRRQSFAEKAEEFASTGKQDFDRFAASVVRSGIDLTSHKTCFELGCGVGRITRWLGERFSEVIAADISQPHLDIARQYLEQRKIGNVSLVRLARLDDLRAIAGFDVFFSVIVLQHNPPPVIAFMLETILGNLNPGGVGFFQVPTYHRRYSFDTRRYLASAGNGGQMEMHLLPQKDVFRIVEAARCSVVEVREDNATGGEWISNSFLVQKRGK